MGIGVWLLEIDSLSVVSVAQSDRALGCGPSGRGFESLHSPQKAPVAQLDRASDFESAGRPFESDRARQANKIANCKFSNATLAVLLNLVELFNC